MLQQIVGTVLAEIEERLLAIGEATPTGDPVVDARVEGAASALEELHSTLLSKIATVQ